MAPIETTSMQRALWAGREAQSAMGGATSIADLRVVTRGLDEDVLLAAWERTVAFHPMLRGQFRQDGTIEILAEHLSPDSYPFSKFKFDRSEDGLGRVRIELALAIADLRAVQCVVDDLMAECDEPGCLERRGAPPTIWPTVSPAASSADWDFWSPMIEGWSPPEYPLTQNPWSATHVELHHRLHEIPLEDWMLFTEHAKCRGIGPGVASLAVIADVLHRWSRGGQVIVTSLTSDRSAAQEDVVSNFARPFCIPLDRNIWTDSSNFAARAKYFGHRFDECRKHASVSALDFNLAIARRLGIGHIPVPTVGQKSRGIVVRHPCVVDVTMHAKTPQTLVEFQLHADDRVRLHYCSVDSLFHGRVAASIFEAFCDTCDLLTKPGGWDSADIRRLPKPQSDIRAALLQKTLVPESSTLSSVTSGEEHVGSDHPALRFGSEIVSYNELRNRRLKWSRGLAARGFGPGAFVAIALPKGIEQVCAALAVVDSGLAYVPVEISWPRERTMKVFQAAGVSAVISNDDFWLDSQFDSVVQLSPTTLDRTSPSLGNVPVSSAKGSDLAYVIFTSGSTGIPKGVAIEHRSAVGTLMDVIQRFGVGSNDCCLALSSLTFDLSVFDVFGMLAAGGSLSIPASDSISDPSELHRTIEHDQVSIWNSVPALMVAYVSFLEATRIPWPSSLRLVMLSGDWIPTDLPSRIGRLSEKVQLISLGGATEASIWSVHYSVEKSATFNTSIPYGYPLANQSVHVFDSALNDVPDFVAGDLYIGGLGVARGYLGDPALTEKSFVNLPGHGRLYRTGDIARFVGHGLLELLGREDSQVKIQGYRVELGEIESVLRAHPRVAEVVVHASSTSGRKGADRQLVAYYVPKHGHPANDENELRTWASTSLPRYMVPLAFVPISQLPLSANGKVDRTQLSQPPPAKGDSRDQSYEGAELRSIWCRVLEVDSVNDTDNFIKLGGTSLTAMRLADLAQRASLPLDVNLVMTRPTFLDQLSEIRKPNEPFVSFRNGTHGMRMLFVPPFGESARVYRTLAQGMRAEWGDLVGLRPATLRQGQSVIDYAHSMLTALPPVWHQEPFVLCGWSAGALLAHALAHVIESQGSKVSHLLLLDPPPLDSSDQYDPQLEADLLLSYLRSVAAPHGILDIHLPHFRSLSDEGRKTEARRALRAIGLEDFDALFETRTAGMNRMKALLEYRPTRVDAEAVAFFPASSARSPWEADVAQYWHDRCKTWTRVDLAEGDHFTMVSKATCIREIDQALTAHFPNFPRDE